MEKKVNWIVSNYRLDMHLDTDEANAAQIYERTAHNIEATQRRQYV
jgi:propanediol utilization protein